MEHRIFGIMLLPRMLLDSERRKLDLNKEKDFILFVGNTRWEFMLLLQKSPLFRSKRRMERAEKVYRNMVAFLSQTRASVLDGDNKKIIEFNRKEAS